YIQQHTRFDKEYKLMMWSSAKGQGMCEIGDIIPDYKGKEYWKAETDKEFEDLMIFFSRIIKEKGFDVLDEMLAEQPDTFETPERKKYFKEHRKELVEKYDAIYHILSIDSKQDQLRKIDEVLWDNRQANDIPEEQEKIYDLLLGMAAIVTEIAIEKEGVEIDYDGWRVEVKYPIAVLNFWPIFVVVQAWLRYHLEEKKDILIVWSMLRTTIRE
ncbi:hypothetical protein D6853_02855, partial [Butyrivibrio sp. X503]|uniref:hypothetical protein n=1 Tax=Butyrivibrio sp. X503 TaxID=2364878 RepID=UPI000ECC8F77